MFVRSASWFVALALMPSGLASERIHAPAPLLPEYPIRLSLEHGERIVGRVLESAVYERLTKHPSWIAAEKRPETRQGLIGLRFLAGALKTDLPGLAKLVLGRRIEAYITPGAEQGADGRVVLIFDLGDEPRATEVFEVLDQTLTLIGAADGAATGADGIHSVNGEEFHALHGASIVVSNDEAAVRATLSALSERSSPPLPGGEMGAEPMTRLQFDFDLARLTGNRDEPAFPEIHENGAAALLVHGLNFALNRAQRFSGAFTIDGERIALDSRLEHPAIDDPRLLWYCAANGPAAPEIWPEGTIATLRLDRKLADYYAHRKDWLAESSENDFLQLDQGLNLFFGGRSFGDEILPALGDSVLFVIEHQEYAGMAQLPNPRLPAVSLVAPLDSTKLKDKDIAMFFQNSIAIINLDRAQNGKDSLLVASEKEHGATIHGAHFDVPELAAGETPSEPDVRFNLSPSITSACGQLVFGTAVDGVKSVVSSLAALGKKKADAANPARTQLRIDVAAVAHALEINRESLIANRMLEEGEERAAAEQAIDLFLLGLRTLSRLELTLGLEQGHFALDGELGFTPAPER